MADEEKKVAEEKVEQGTVEEPRQPQETRQASEPEPKQPDIDYSAIEAMQSEIAQLRQDSQTSKKAEQKLENIGRILAGEQGKSFDKDKFFNDLANDPEKTLEDFYKERSSKETNDLKEEIKRFRMEREDTAALQRLSNEDPDFNDVMSNMGKVMPTEEFQALYKSLESNPKRNDFIYYEVKARLNKLSMSKKEIEDKANKEAKDNINKTAKSEIPASGGTVETKTTEDERRERIAKARDKFDVDSVLDEVMDGDYTSIWRSNTNR